MGACCSFMQFPERRGFTATSLPDTRPAAFLPAVGLLASTFSPSSPVSIWQPREPFQAASLLRSSLVTSSLGLRVLQERAGAAASDPSAASSLPAHTRVFSQRELCSLAVPEHSRSSLGSCTRCPLCLEGPPAAAPSPDITPLMAPCPLWPPGCSVPAAHCRLVLASCPRAQAGASQGPVRCLMAAVSTCSCTSLP